MDYVKTVLKEELPVKRIITIHYFEYSKNYAFEGEKHDFWEFLCVDKGEVEVMAGSLIYNLSHGEVIFHKPNEFHNVWANGRTAPNVIVVSFECNAKGMRFFENRILRIGDIEKALLANIIREAQAAYTSPLNNPRLKRLEKDHARPFGSEQLIKTYLEQLLIQMVRNAQSISREVRLSTSMRESTDEMAAKRVAGFLEANIYHNISFGDVCRFSNLSGTQLKVLFKEKTGMSVMEYYRRLKTDQAKRMIREGSDNFTQVASKLGYSSIHYFSRRFKADTGMTPTEYAVSVKIKI